MRIFSRTESLAETDAIYKRVNFFWLVEHLLEILNYMYIFDATDKYISLLEHKLIVLQPCTTFYSDDEKLLVRDSHSFLKKQRQKLYR